MKFDNYLFRCSALGHLMEKPDGKTNLDIYLASKAKYDQRVTELDALPKYDKKTGLVIMKSWENKKAAVDREWMAMDYAEKHKDDVQLSIGAKTHLMDIYISEKYGRKTDITNKYVEKGLTVEEDGITIYSRIKKVFFRKNETHLKNLFIKGTPDSFIGKSIHEADEIPDIKCSWNIYTFLRTFTKDINTLYYWQGVGYMWLTGAKRFNLAYCLVNTPTPLIEAEKRSLWYKLGQPENDNSNFIDACNELEKSMLYDDIPLNEKLLEYSIERREEDIELLKKKIIAARAYLNELHELLTVKFSQAA
jgi:hypothetical protein